MYGCQIIKKNFLQLLIIVSTESMDFVNCEREEVVPKMDAMEGGANYGQWSGLGQCIGVHHRH